eukprot:2099587-Prymnesium_polylepis.1
MGSDSAACCSLGVRPRAAQEVATSSHSAKRRGGHVGGHVDLSRAFGPWVAVCRAPRRAASCPRYIWARILPRAAVKGCGFR